MPAATCIVCGDDVGDSDRFVLLSRRGREAYCSEACLVVNVERRRRARAALRRRWLLGAAAVAAVAIGGPRLWHRVRLPRAESISFQPPDLRPATPSRPEPPMFGPAWPPTDQDWLTAFAQTTWAYPLPGPVRRLPAADEHILAARLSSGHQPPACHDRGLCGVDLGGELWGEQVYAAHDGVVDHIQRAFDDERGDVYVRLSHFGGMVFTHYFHLAAIPRTLGHGTVVKAGEVIGLVGDTGNEHPGHYIHFALSVRPTADLPEVYWDPRPLMAGWPLHQPPHGTVAGYVPPDVDLPVPPFRRRLNPTAQ
jgi:murein DD-endopeptidase MepM/ murein hydrolase activator NlpD